MPEISVEKAPQRISIFNPRTAPVRGMKSFPDPSTLNVGEYALLQNFRFDKGALTVRDGTTKLTSSAISTGTFKGAGMVTLNGTVYHLAAFFETPSIKVFSSTDAVTYTEITTAYRSSRFSGDLRTGDRVTFTPLRVYTPAKAADEKFGRDVLLIQTGAHAPRIWDPQETESSLKCVPHLEIPPPSSSSVQKVVAGAGLSSFGVRASVSGMTFTNSDALDFSGAATATTGDLEYATLTVPNGHNASATVKLTAPVPTDFSKARQLWVVCETDFATSKFLTAPAAADVWDMLKVEISEDDSTYTTVWDPSSTAYTKLVVDMDVQDVGPGVLVTETTTSTTGGTTNPFTGQTFNQQTVTSTTTRRKQSADKVFLVSFPLDNITPSLRDSVKYIRFTWSDATTLTGANTVTVDIYMIAPSGSIVGGSDFQATYYSTNSRAESRPITLPYPTGQRIYDAGGSKYNEMVIPYNESLYYAFTVNHAQPSSTFADTYNADKILIYRRDVTGGDYLYATYGQNARYASDAWTAITAYAISGIVIDDDAVDIFRKAPDSYHRPIPGGTATLWASNRLFVGNIAEPVYGDTTVISGTSNTGTDKTLDERWSAIKFTVGGSDVSMDGIKLKLKRTNTITNPEGRIYGFLYSDNAGSPGTRMMAAADSIAYSELQSATYQTFDFNLKGATTLTASTAYWFVLWQTAAPGTGTVQIGCTASGTAQYSEGDNSTAPAWVNENSVTAYFDVYSRGTTYSYSRGDVFVSELDDPTRFRELARTEDSRSPTKLTFHGEQIRHFADVSTSLYGSTAIYVFTDKSVGLLNGVSADQLSIQRKVAEIGALQGDHVKQWRGTIYFLDTEMQVRRMRGGAIDDLSRGTVEDKFKAVSDSRKSKMAGAIFNDRYYIGYTDPEGSRTDNGHVMIFDERIPLPYQDKLVTTMSVESCQTWNDGGTIKFLVYGSGGHVFRYENPSATTEHDATNIAVTLTTGEFTDRMWERMTVNRVGMVCTDASEPGTISMVATYPYSAAAATMSLNPNVSTTEAWRWTTVPYTPSGDPSGPSFKLSFTASFAGGRKIRSLVAEIASCHDGSGADST